MRATRLLIVSVLMGLFFGASAQAATLSVVGAFNSSSMSGTIPTTATRGFGDLTEITAVRSGHPGYGGGILFGGMFGSRIGLETGALYITRKNQEVAAYTFSGLLHDISDATTTATAIQIPLLVRFWPVSFISAGVGGYYALGIKTETTGTLANYSSISQLNKNDFGLLGSVALSIPFGQTVKFLIDGRYSFGLSNVNADGTTMTINYRDIQVLSGLSFVLGGSGH